MLEEKRKGALLLSSNWPIDSTGKKAKILLLRTKVVRWSSVLILDRLRDSHSIFLRYTHEQNQWNMQSQKCWTFH